MRPRTAAQLVEDLRSDDDTVQREAERRLIDMGADAVPALQASLEGGGSAYVALVLSRIVPPAEGALPVLRRRMKGQPELGWVYAAAIARIKPGDAGDVLPFLGAGLDQGGGAARLSAGALGRIDTAESRQVLVARVSATDRAVRHLAARTLAGSKAPDAALVLPVLLEALAEAADDSQREQIVLDVANLEREGRPALEALVAAYERGGRELHLAAAISIAWVAPAAGVRVLPTLLSGLEDPRPAARRDAAAAIAQLGSPARPHQPAIDRLLNDPVTSVQEGARAAANTLLDKRAHAQPLEALRLKAIFDEPGRRRAFFLSGPNVVEAEAGTWLHDGRVEAIEPDAVVIAQDVVDERLRLTRRTVRLALFASGARPLPAQPTRSSKPVTPISVALAAEDLRDVMNIFAMVSEMNVVLQHTARCVPQTKLMRAWPWDAALEYLLRSCGLDYQVEGTFVRVASKADLARYPYVQEKYTGHYITMEFVRGRLPDLWDLFQDISGLKIEPHPEGESSMWCKECRWDEVFAALVRSQGYTYTVDGAIIRLKPLP